MSKNITEELDLNHLAGIATCSLHDFQRMFGHIAEMTISEYIRYRRLTLAGLELKHSDVKVIDVSLKYGYESPVSFARAFQAFHGCTPSMAKMPHVALKMFPRRLFQIIVREVSQMIRKDKIVVNGKEYEAAYFGEQDMSHWSKHYSKREFWRLENVGDDFKGKATSNSVLPYNNYPANMNFEVGQVFVVDYTKIQGDVERKYYIADGTIWEEEGNLPCTREFSPEFDKDTEQILRTEKLTVDGKEYTASYFGEQDMSHWSDYANKREFWRLENAGDDFKNKRTENDVLPYNNYPSTIKFEIGQVFVVAYTKKDGEIEYAYYIADGFIWEEEGNIPCTRQFWLD